MDARLLYNQLLDEIREDETALTEKKELVRLLKKRLDAMPRPAATAHAPTTQAVAFNIKGGVGKTFAAMVEEAIPALAGREFVVSDVAEAMRTMGFEIDEKPNAKITTVLARLQETGALVRTFTGGGNVPNRFRIASEVQDSKSSSVEDLLA